MLRRILIVDDNVVNRKILRKILSNDYEVLEAGNGADALSVLEANVQTVSAVLLDIAMPVMNGYEVIKVMRADGDMSQIPVIVTTGNSDTDSEVEALSVGANDFIAKPYNYEIIKHRLRNTINLRETAALVNAARTDKLTGLYSREAFYEKAAQMIAEHETGFYVMACFDIDNFKVINDQYGSETGDKTLKYIAQTFKEGFEPVGGICSRIAADNFAVLYPEKFMNTDALAKIRDKAADVQGLLSPVTFSIGRYIINDLSLSISAMYDRAAIAEASVKGRFDTHIAQYDEIMREDILREQQIVNEMKDALAQEQFEVWFQPQYNHSTGALIGAEALVRWLHPKKGYIQPDVFIPVFERNGFIYELDRFVWEKSCAFLRRWIDEGRSPLPLSVNLSRYDLFQDNLTETIISIVEKYDIPVGFLRIEITESAFAKSTSQIIAVVKQLVEYGFTIEIDDFGSGYSSLNTLKDVPADVLKLDMRFLESKEITERSGNILESIVRMAKWLGMPVIAEGVENIEQAEYLKSIGCYYVQGYLYARPMKTSDYEALASGVIREEKMLILETVETLDNNAFWNPKSIETLIFNSYVGGACIFEYYRGAIELLRSNKKYAPELVGDDVPIDTATAIEIDNYMDEANRAKMYDNIKRAIDTNDESICELQLIDLPHNPGVTYIRATVRLIARVGERMMFYSTIINMTAQREAERKVRETSEQLKSIIENVNGGVSAVTFDEDGEISFVFANSQYYSILGYTKEQFEAEVTSVINIVHPADRERILDVVSELMQRQTTDVYEYRCIKRDGSDIYVRCNASVTSIAGIKEKVLLSVITDTTELMKAEIKVAETSQRLHAIMNNAGSGITAITLNGEDVESLFVNDRFYDMLGYTGRRRERKAKSPLDFIYFEDKKRVMEKINHSNLTGEQTFFDFRAVRVDGTVIWLRCTMSVTRLADIEQAVLLGVFFDITAEKQAQEKLIELNARIKSDSETLINLMNDTPGGFVRRRLISDNESELVYVNDGFCELLGMTRDEVMNAYRKAYAGVHPEDIASVRGMVAQMASTQGQISGKYRLRGGNGEYVWVMVFGRFVKNEDGGRFINLYYTDMSESVRLEKQREELLSKLSRSPAEQDEYSFYEMLPVALAAVMESSTDLMFIKNKNFVYQCCSSAFAKMAGLESAGDIVGKTDYEIFSKELADKYRADDQKLLASGASMVDCIELIPSEGGVAHYSSTSKYLLHDSYGNVMGIYGNGRDITQNRSAFEQLKLLKDSIPGGLAMYRVSPQGIRALYINDGTYNVLGYDAQEYEELIKDDVMHNVFDEDRPLITAQVESLLRDGTPMNVSYRIYTKQGQCRWMNMHAIISERYEDSAIVNAVMFDVTERITAEERARINKEELMLSMSKIGKMICEYDPVTHVLIVPQAYAQQHGIDTVVENIPECVEDMGMICKESLCEHKRFFDEIFSGAKSGIADWRVRCADGSYCWEHADFSTIFDSNSKPVKVIIAIEDTTRQHEKEYEAEVIKNSERVFKLVAAHSSRIICRYDIASRTVQVETANPAWEKALTNGGNLPESGIQEGIILSDSVEDYRKIFRDMHAGKPEGGAKIHMRADDGSSHWIDMKYSLIFNSSKKPVSAVISFLDVTQSHEKELAYERYQQTIVHNASEDSSLVYLESDVTADLVEKYGGSILTKTFPSTEHTRTDFIEYVIKMYVAENDRERCIKFFSREHLMKAFSENRRTLSEDWSVTYAGGKIGYVCSDLQLVQDPFSGHIKAYTTFKDITEQKQEALDLLRLAETDGMTELYNKTTAQALIKQQLSGPKGEACALLIADLDNLKAINDNLGHDSGDKAIRLFADVLRSQFRKTDIIGRSGGDEFVVFLDGGGNEARLRSTMLAFMKKLSVTYVDDDNKISICGSVGIAIGKKGKDSYEQLFKRADLALYHVKRNGKNDFALYTPEMEQGSYRFMGHGATSMWRAAFFDKEELDHLLKAVSLVYPLVISVNLTRNSYYMMQYESYMTKKCLSVGSFDELIATGAQTFHPDDREAFINAFSRESLLAAHSRGEMSVSHNGRQLGDDGVYRQIHTDVIFVKSKSSDDVLEITLGREMVAADKRKQTK